MFNSWQITFIDTLEAHPGDSNVLAYIKFAYGLLAAPYLKVGEKFTFGEMGHTLGEGMVLQIMN